VAVGGQGCPEEGVERALPWPPAGEGLPLDAPAFGAPAFGTLGELVPALPAPGRVPQGEPLGVVPGVVEVFGFTVDGCVLVPGVGGVVEFDPGTAPGVVAPVGGGVGLLVGGAVVVLVGGLAVLGACAVLPAAPAGAVAPAERCATAQVVQPRIRERKISLAMDII
jgi:hypothetical protein